MESVSATSDAPSSPLSPAQRIKQNRGVREDDIAGAIAGSEEEVWRTRFVEYYKTNAPTKVALVTDAFMAKWVGKYDTLFTNLVKKYGEPGHPIEPPPPTKKGGNSTGKGGGTFPNQNGGKGAGSGKKTIGDWHDTFVTLVAKATPQLPEEEAPCAIDAKAANEANGLDTSTFTICTRIRPVLGDELSQGGENFVCIVPGGILDTADRTEQALVLTPKVGITGKPKLEKDAFDFDHTFGPNSTNEQIYRAIGRPLVARAMGGQVAVVFAYGQTSSGKTHTMNGLMDNMVHDVFGQGDRVVEFSYLEVLGPNLNDCLSNAKADVKIGEMQDGSVKTVNLSEHRVDSPQHLEQLIGVAKTKRSTASTERNDTSSRSHGIGIVKIGHPGYDLGEGPAAGTLYIIDLAGSERAADSKNHTKQRMEETKAINLSLLNLKECIRARTRAATAGAAEVHVPYRRSKLTLLMKDVFEVSCPRMSSTVVIATVSPLAKDCAHSANTLKYAAPLRVSIRAAPSNLEHDRRDPALWTHDRAVEWLNTELANHFKVAVHDRPAGCPFDAEVLIPGLGGRDMCMITEPDMFARVHRLLPGDDDKADRVSRGIYSTLWTMIVDAKTRRRRPDGTIITEEQEAQEQEEADARNAAKVALWKEREAHLQSELSFGDDGLSTDKAGTRFTD